MKKWNISPAVSVGELRFHSDRSEVREKLGLNYKEVKKSIFSKSTMDAYESFHVYYSERNEMEAIEFFEGNQLTVNGKSLFPGEITAAQKLIPDLIDDGYGYISKSLAIGITTSADDPAQIESVLIGCSGYYS